MIIEDDDSGTINVAIRIRPLSSSEKERGDVAAWNVSENRDKIIASDALKEYIQNEQKNVKEENQLGTIYLGGDILSTQFKHVFPDLPLLGTSKTRLHVHLNNSGVCLNN